MPKKLTTKEHQAYQPASQGPFRCGSCEYFIGKSNCRNEKVIEWAKKEKFGLHMNGLHAEVEPEACCDEFEKA